MVLALLGPSCRGQAIPTPTRLPTLVVAPRERVGYRIELLEPETPIVGIHVEAPGDADGLSEFTLAEGWAGVAESGQDLALVEARSAAEPS